MKTIHVVLLDYNNRVSLEKAIVSVQHIPYVSKITALSNKPLLSSFKLSSLPLQEKLIVHNDIGMTLNQLITNINTDFVLFLYNEDYINDPQTLTAAIKRDADVLTAPYTIQNITNQRPCLIKSSLLKKHPFLNATQVPFSEAIYSIWLNTLKKEKMLQLDDGCIRQYRKTKNADAYQKQLYLNKLDFTEQGVHTPPNLTILMPTYNMAAYIETALFSCLHQTRRAANILVIDDGSTDTTASKLKKWEQAGHIHYFQTKNGGKARALNQLLPHVTTDFILELDADDWLDPNAIASISQRLQRFPKNCAVLYGDLRYWRETSDKKIQYKGIKKGQHVGNEKALMTYRFPLGPRIYRTSALKAIQGFPVIDFQDGRLFEDVSVLKALIAYASLKYEPFTVYNVREHKESITKSNHSKWSDYLKSLN
ncbi:hypothetical protein JOD43_001111 [Pullulanibacillus pueri]|uniref:Glycosyltransferase 2-like domain-containing protein n=1 Tax=Pullulanibacillus pueri TaxID=1437324 RepID=A0A8J2ZVH1_9BACL|nr:glycosyltransferase family 2 protein [Pullulanibacillus pueri]MBM7680945.1 hypothetical protein [Pullulanibacillus pueri]GGH81434.1 hypothetical protein GCM10007096_19330 [Pullulanibacillus pueri]